MAGKVNEGGNAADPNASGTNPNPTGDDPDNLEDPPNDDDIDDLKPKEREMFNVMNEDEEIQLLFLSYHNFGKLLEEEIREEEDYGGFADLEDGHKLSVRFKMETLGKNKYLKASKIDFKDREDLDESILDDVLNLDAIMIIKSYDDLYNEFWDVDDDKSEKKEKKKTTSSRRKKNESKKDESKKDKKEEKKTTSRRKKKTPEKKEKATPKKKKEKPKKLECPEDLDFGADFDEYECCDDCDIRKECGEKSGVDTSKDESSDDKSSGDGECPHGHEFGADCNKKDDCDECNEWEACQDAHDAM